MTIGCKLAKQKAEQLRKEYKMNDPLVHGFGITEAEGLTLKFVEMPKKLKDVLSVFDLDKKIIYINYKETPVRQHFAVAHELGHYLLGHKDFEVLLKGTHLITKNPKEKEANCFAKELIVPAKKLKRIMRKYDLSLAYDIQILSNIFGASKRLIELQV